MFIREVLSTMASHMIEGMMVHEQLMNAYLFMNFHGYSACHEYHYLSETRGYINLCKYSLKHLGYLLDTNVKTKSIPNVLPKSWYDFNRSDVSHDIRISAIKTALDKWIEWEEETKALYEKCYSELLSHGYIADAEFVKSYILDVESELVYARNEKLLKESMNYDIVSIVEEQLTLKRRFHKKIRKIGDGYYEDE